MKIELPAFIRQPLLMGVVVAIAVLSAVLIVRTPKKATEVTIRATKVTAQSITPTIEKLTHVPRKQKKQFAQAVIVGVIIVSSVVACVLTIPIMTLINLPPSATWFVSVTLCILTLGTLTISMVLTLLSREHTSIV